MILIFQLYYILYFCTFIKFQKWSVVRLWLVKITQVLKRVNGAESLSFYRFYRLPRDSKLKRTWLANIKILYPKEENIRVCHLHFEETVFKET